MKAGLAFDQMGILSSRASHPPAVREGADVRRGGRRWKGWIAMPTSSMNTRRLVLPEALQMGICRENLEVASMMIG